MKAPATGGDRELAGGGQVKVPWSSGPMIPGGGPPMAPAGHLSSTLLLVTQSRLTLCDPVDSSSPGCSVSGILQARILEWVAIPFSRGSSQSRDQTRVSCIAGRFLTAWTTREANWSLYCMPSTWHVSSYFFLTSTWLGQYYSTHLIDEETEAQKRYVTCGVARIRQSSRSNSS